MSVGFYDQHAARFAADTLSVDVSALYQQFLPLLPSRALILDAGCGTGRDSRFFLTRGLRVAAFDASAEMVRIARKITSLPVQQADFLTFRTTESFDAIWACASLLHVPANMLPATFTHLAAQLKPQGLFYCSFKLGESDTERDGRHFTNMTAERLAKQLEISRLRILKSWITDDARPERTDEKWLNALLERIS